MKFRILLGATMILASLAATATGLAGTAGVASADPVHVPICGRNEGAVGAALSGTYHNLTVTHIAYVRQEGQSQGDGRPARWRRAHASMPSVWERCKWATT